MIDLRSDTVTKPTLEMRNAMAQAEVGDDVFQEDPTVHRLEKMSAALLGKEAALFVPSGTQANLISILSQCNRGDEYIAGQNAHCYKWEAGGCAVLGSVQPQPVPVENDGTLDLEIVRKSIKPDDVHFAKTKLLALENTMWGRVLPVEYLEKAAQLAKNHQLSMHLDGARIFNAAVALNIPVREIAKHFDTVSFCLSKGLGAPVGSMICSTKELIDKARHLRKMLGGGMRQAGIIAAAGIYALEHHIDRLAQDHANAACLAQQLQSISRLHQQVEVNTNIILVHLDLQTQTDLLHYLKAHHILALGRDGTIRFVTHLDINAEDIEKTIQAIKQFFQCC